MSTVSQIGAAETAKYLMDIPSCEIPQDTDSFDSVYSDISTGDVDLDTIFEEVSKEYNVNINADIMCDATEVRVEAVKKNMGIAYVIKEAVKNELNNKELYEVEMPIELPSLKLNLIYLKGELTKVDKKFIKEYLKNI